MATRQNNASSSEMGVDPTPESKSTVDTTDSTNGTINGILALDFNFLWLVIYF